MNYSITIQNDGFGAQYQKIIETYLYCKLNNLNFLYSPFTNVAHNYDNNKNFVNNIENLINLKNNLPNVNDNKVIRLDYGDIVRNFSNKNIDIMCKSKYLEFIKKCFWENKDKNIFKNENINVAIHIRRPNPCDDRIEGANTPNNYYLNIIKIIREKYANKNLLFHIYSQGQDKNFEIYKATDTILHLNEDLILTFIGMVRADILVMSASSLSYTAALLSEGIIYYKKFWHPPRKEWFIFD